METCPDARLISDDGMKKGDNLRGPFSCTVSEASKIDCSPPMPEPIITPVRSRSSSAIGCQPESSTACEAAPIA
jgi:hypothetical protein